jgi:hypothetical protein
MSALAKIALALTALLTVVGLLADGAGGGLTLLGLSVLLMGAVAVLRGRLNMFKVRSRRGGLWVLAAGFGLLAVGGAMLPAGPADQPTAADGLIARGATAAGTDTGSAEPLTPTTSHSTAPATTAGERPTASRTTSSDTGAKGTALAAVAGLEVKGRSAKTGYARAQFGEAWYDTDHNGCDTRNDILRRDLTARQMKNACKVLAGTLGRDPYTGQPIRFVYGGASEIDIDHVVPLSDAWQKGASRWTAGKRLALANDPLNLLAVDSSTNRSKGDGDAATWLPPYKAYRCEYVARQVAVKSKYAVSVTAAEKSAMERVLHTCPGQVLPTPGAAPTVAALPRSASTSAPKTTTASSESGTANQDVRENVHPGSFCTPHGALGRTDAGVLMRCTTTATDSRNRWRRA